jgi:hypothetical protein
LSKRKSDPQRGPATTLGQFPPLGEFRPLGEEPPPAQAHSGNGPAVPDPAAPDLAAPDPPPEGPSDERPASVANPRADADPLHPLELRIRRLEDALAQLLDVKVQESRPAAPPPREQPPPAPAAPSPTGVVLDVAQRLVERSGALVTAAAPAPTPAPAVQPTPTVAPASRPAWLLWETLAEARAILRMYLDPRYRLSWLGKILPPLLLVAIVFSDYWFLPAQIPFKVGWLLNKAMDLVLAFVLFKVLGHEARRYRETAPDLPPSLRL